MRHIVSAFVVAILVMLASHSPDASGQVTCTFLGGFSRIRDLIGADKVGACLDDEHFNADTGNVEQDTTGGLLVWRKADNVTAFTDGGTTWLNGPEGFQNRPNDQRFAWEQEPAAPAAASVPPAPAPVADVAPAPAAAAPDPLPPAPSPSPAPVNAGTLASAPPQASPSVAAQPPVSAAALAAPTSTPTPKPTKVPTATPTATVKFSEKPGDVDAGLDAHFEIETTVTKGTCAATITYRDSTIQGLPGKAVDDDGKCEWTWNVPDRKSVV